MSKHRLSQFRRTLAEAGLDAMFVANRSNVRYLSGYTGDDSYLLITAEKAAFITDFRYSEQAEQECPEFEVVPHRNSAPSLPQVVQSLCREQEARRLAFERKYLQYGLYDDLRSAVGAGVELVPVSGLVEKLRCVKEPAELEKLRLACAATDRAFAAICRYIRPGVTERDVARELYYAIQIQGCESSFRLIVAAGGNGSLPHAIPSDKVIQPGEFVTIDFGCRYQGYHADMTRTVVVGQPDDKQRKLYRIVLEANLRAQAAIRAGLPTRDGDAAARDYIEAQGYGRNFGHGLGHGVGLDIHEDPFLSRVSEQILQTNCVVTVEPGIYLPGWGGLRIEDTVLVTENGCESLFQTTKELICL